MNIAFISLGCDKNLVDSEIMLGIIDREGYTITDDEQNADVIIINTCGFILDATQESIDTILEAVKNKNENKIKKIIVTGCMVQRYKEEIFKEIPEIDAIVGTSEFDKIGEIIKQVNNDEKPVLISDINKNIDLNNKRLVTTSYYAYLKIAEGCDNKCTYCTIPSIRGKYRSRTLEDLIEETKILASNGVKELVLVAQDTSLYGTDIYGENKLHILLKQLSDIEGIEWIRLLYAYPETITDETIKEINQNNKICNYLDIPIQHSEDKILKLMGRKITKKQIQDLIKKLRHNITDVVLRTSIIVGFPSETEEDFNNLLEFLQDVKFDKLGVFAYSKEENTPAAKLKDQISKKIKLKRRDVLMQMQQQISNDVNQKYIGKTIKAIVVGKLPDEDCYCARGYMDCQGYDGYTFFDYDGSIDSGEFVNVKITNASNYDLFGVIDFELS